MGATRLPTTFHVGTPHGEVGLWWLDVPVHQSHQAQRQYVRQQAAQILDRQFPTASLAHIHWPAGAMHPPNLAYAAQALPPVAAEQAPALWLSWSYLRMSLHDVPQRALLAMAPMPVGVDACAGSLLDVDAWASVLKLYGRVTHVPTNPQACAQTWTGIEAADKCLQSGLREWSPHVAAERAWCTLVELPLAHPHIAATLAWLPPQV